MIIGSVVFGNLLSKGCMNLHNIVSFAPWYKSCWSRSHCSPSQHNWSLSQNMCCLNCLNYLNQFHYKQRNIDSTSTLCKPNQCRDWHLESSWQQYLSNQSCQSCQSQKLCYRHHKIQHNSCSCNQSSLHFCKVLSQCCIQS